MTLDKPEHKQFLLQMFSQVQIPGPFVDLAYEVKKAITDAEVAVAVAMEGDPVADPVADPGS